MPLTSNLNQVITALETSNANLTAQVQSMGASIIRQQTTIVEQAGQLAALQRSVAQLASQLEQFRSAPPVAAAPTPRRTDLPPVELERRVGETDSAYRGRVWRARRAAAGATPSTSTAPINRADLPLASLSFLMETDRAALAAEGVTTLGGLEAFALSYNLADIVGPQDASRIYTALSTPATNVAA